jgi:hypothetical protein
MATCMNTKHVNTRVIVWNVGHEGSFVLTRTQFNPCMPIPRRLKVTLCTCGSFSPHPSCQHCAVYTMLVTDEGSYLVYYGLPLTLVGWLAAIKVRAVTVLQLMLSLQLALGVYFIMHIYNPEVFPTNSLVMAGVVFAISIGLLMAVYCGAAMLIYLACLTIVIPIFKHNGQLVADWLHLPSWGGVAVFVFFMVALVALVLLSKVLDFAGLLLKIIVTTTTFVMMMRITYMEHQDGDQSKVFTCDGIGADKQYPSRCPLTWSLVWAAVYCMCILTQVVSILTCGRSKKKKKSKTTRPKKLSISRKGPPHKRSQSGGVKSPVYTAAAVLSPTDDGKDADPEEEGEEQDEEHGEDSSQPGRASVQEEWDDFEVEALSRSTHAGLCGTLRRRVSRISSRNGDGTDVSRLDGH